MPPLSTESGVSHRRLPHHSRWDVYQYQQQSSSSQSVDSASSKVTVLPAIAEKQVQWPDTCDNDQDDHAVLVQIRLGLTRSEYTPQERRQSWYSTTELQSIHRSAATFIRHYQYSQHARCHVRYNYRKSSSSKTSQSSSSQLRGLEFQTVEGYHCIRQHRSTALMAVLEEQHAQRVEMVRLRRQEEAFYARHPGVVVVGTPAMIMMRMMTNPDQIRLAYEASSSSLSSSSMGVVPLCRQEAWMRGQADAAAAAASAAAASAAVNISSNHKNKVLRHEGRSSWYGMDQLDMELLETAIVTSPSNIKGKRSRSSSNNNNNVLDGSSTVDRHHHHRHHNHHHQQHQQQQQQQQQEEGCWPNVLQWLMAPPLLGPIPNAFVECSS